MSLFRKSIDLLLILRPHHWVKNLLVFFPLILVSNDQIQNHFASGLVAFAIFSIAASIIYIINDLIDYKDDRHNPSKIHRPIAADKVTKQQARIVTSMLFILLAYALWSSGERIITLIVLYIIGNIIYSTVAKKIVFLDLVLISTFFCLRLLTGAKNMEVELGYLHYSLTLFCFLGFAALKRYVEISKNPHGVLGRSYSGKHLVPVTILGLFCALVSIILLVFVLRDPLIRVLYSHSQVLMALVPLFIGEIVFLVKKAKNKKLSDDLTMLWRKDLGSQIFFITAAVIIILAR